MKKVFERAAVFVLLCFGANPGVSLATGAVAKLPAAIYQDPTSNAANPALSGGLRFNVGGTWINGFAFVPAGSGSHPTAVLLHGLPGNEQNLDLARALQRAGWTVITFNYRGTWGSGGAFSLNGGIKDANAILDKLHKPALIKALHVDPTRVALIGHSYGGYLAVRAAASHPWVHAIVLIAPWSEGYDAQMWAKLGNSGRDRVTKREFSDAEGRITGATPASLVDEVIRDGASSRLSAYSSGLIGRNVLVITDTKDDDDAKAIGLLKSLHGDHNVTHIEMNTDHDFDDHRIALETAILNWLSTAEILFPK